MNHSNSNVEPPDEPPLIRNLHHHLTALANAHLWIKVLVGMAAGIVTGVALGPTTGWLNPDTATVVGNWLAFPGQLFLTLVQMIVIPLVFASIVMGLAASENIQQLKQMGLKSVLFFVVTTAVATAIGIGMAYLIKPGDLIDKTLLQQDLGSALHTIPQSAQVPSIAELPNKVLLLLPSNPLSSMVEGQMLQVLLFAMIFGVALLTLAPGKSKPLLEVLGSLQEVYDGGSLGHASRTLCSIRVDRATDREDRLQRADRHGCLRRHRAGRSPIDVNDLPAAGPRPHRHRSVALFERGA